MSEAILDIYENVSTQNNKTAPLLSLKHISLFVRAELCLSAADGDSARPGCGRGGCRVKQLRGTAL